MRTERNEIRLSEDLSKLVEAGIINLKQAQEMMPPKLTTDLQNLVDNGEITREQAVKVMSETRPAPTLVEHCGMMVSTGVMTGEQAGNLLSKIQEEDQQKCIRESKLLSEDPILKRSWGSRQEAVDHIKYHSTRKGRRVLVDSRSSNSGRIVFRCASWRDRDCECNYHAVVRRSKKKGLTEPWRLKNGTKSEDLKHSVTCTSKAKLTYSQAIMNLKTTKSQKLPTIKDTRDRISRDNNVTQATVSPWVAAQVRLAEANQIFADYDANWAKLDGWGEQLKARNPGSVYHVDVYEGMGGKFKFKRMFVGLRSAAWVAANTGAYGIGV